MSTPPAFRPESLAGVSVLLVEDHDDSRNILVDVVVTDFSLPVKDGVWLLERVRERPRRVPVIAITAYTEFEAERLAGAAFSRVLRKPIEPTRLCAEILAVL